MSSYGSEDKNHLAMLAIPVILSMLLGFSGDVRAMERTAEESTPTQRMEENNREISDGREALEQRGDRENETDDLKTDIQQAVDEGDYESFLFLTKGTPFAEIMTESAFHELREQYQHSRAGFAISPYQDRGSTEN